MTLLAILRQGGTGTFEHTLSVWFGHQNVLMGSMILPNKVTYRLSKKTTVAPENLRHHTNSISPEMVRRWSYAKRTADDLSGSRVGRRASLTNTGYFADVADRTASKLLA